MKSTRTPPKRRRRTIALDLELLESRWLPSTTAASYAQLPLAFEPNEGQTTANFLAHGSGYTLLLNAGQATLGLQQAAPQGSSSANALASPGTTEVLSMRLVGANSAATSTALDKLPGVSNYLIGDNPADWHTNIPTYGQVEYQNVYPGIDQIYYGNQGQLEYDLVVNPGANPGTIRLQIAGTQSMTLNANGDLVLHTAGGDVIEKAPVVYQQINGVRESVAGRYVLQDGGQIGFAVGAYNASLPLTIDPILIYSTYLGGSGFDFATSIAVDAAGDAYVAGGTTSPDFPTVNALQTSNTGETPFVAKFNAQGSALVYSTYLGGGGYANSIAVDATGDIYLAGETGFSNFPTVNAVQRTLKGSLYDGFVAKLNAQGNALVYSTYLGGSGVFQTSGDYATGIAVDAAGNASVTGYTSSTDFPTFNALQATLKTTHGNAFVTKLNAQGGFVYSTYLGGTGAGNSGDSGAGIAVDAAGDAYVVGGTSSSDFPTANAFQRTIRGGQNAFVTKLNPQGSALVYSTYLGGSGNVGGDGAAAIALDAGGNAYVTGSTSSTNFPTANAFQKSLNGAINAFVTKLDAQGNALVYSTYLGGSSFDNGSGIAIDAAGDAYVAGSTESTNFPTVNAFQTTKKGFQDAFVALVDSQGSGLLYSTYLGGSGGADEGAGIAVDATGAAYVAGKTRSTDFPTANAFQSSLAGQNSAFVAKILSHAFSGQDVAADASGRAHLLWDSYNGQSVQWSVGNSLNVNSGAVFGPFSGWTAVAVAAGSDGLTRILWTNTDGETTLWLEDSSGMLISHAFSPISGWSAKDVAVGSNGDTLILWTNSSGTMVVWSVDGKFNVTSSPVYGPISGWTATRIAAGSDGLTRVLWENSDGAAAVWFLNSSGALVNTGVFGPISGWTATDITVGPDSLTRILWDNVNGSAVVWNVSNSLAVTSSPLFGPLPDWTAERLADGSDGVVRLLWDNVGGQASLWLLDANGRLLTAGVFGPM
jgi:hypothetical protein